MSESREIYFHEDDYCQQQLLPHAAKANVDLELKKIDGFSDAHYVEEAGWSDIFIREAPAVPLASLMIHRDEIASAIPTCFPPFDAISTGYGSTSFKCQQTAAWGTSQANAILIDWNDQGIVQNIWTELFDLDDDALQAAVRAISAIGELRPLIYVDWAWGYSCEVRSREFEQLLRSKLMTMSEP